MKVWTAQYNYSGGDRVDITVKSGNRCFAPTWSMVLDWKSGTLSPMKYTELYKDLMRASFRSNPEEWRKLCLQPEVTLVCFCKSGTFCHRYILVDLLEKVCQHWNIPFTRMGER